MLYNLGAHEIIQDVTLMGGTISFIDRNKHINYRERQEKRWLKIISSVINGSV